MDKEQALLKIKELIEFYHSDPSLRFERHNSYCEAFDLIYEFFPELEQFLQLQTLLNTFPELDLIIEKETVISKIENLIFLITSEHERATALRFINGSFFLNYISASEHSEFSKRALVE